MQDIILTQQNGASQGGAPFSSAYDAPTVQDRGENNAFGDRSHTDSEDFNGIDFGEFFSLQFCAAHLSSDQNAQPPYGEFMLIIFATLWQMLISQRATQVRARLMGITYLIYDQTNSLFTSLMI